MSLAYLAQPDQQPTVEWLDGGEFAVLLDAAPPTVSWGRPFRVSQGEAPRSHKGLDEDEVVMLISGTALLWSDEQQMALSQNGIVFLPNQVPHDYRTTSPTADLLMSCTPGGFEGMLRQEGKPVTSPRTRHSEPDRDALIKASDDCARS
jgi:hypothetical protein